MKVIGLSGWSGAGKTTLLTRVIPYFLSRGLRVSVIKHAHHEFDVDVPGKDSWVHRQSGATEVVVSSTRRWALMHELRGAHEPRLPELLAKNFSIALTSPSSSCFNVIFQRRSGLAEPRYRCSVPSMKRSV